MRRARGADDPWSDEALEALRGQGDPLADDFAASAREAGTWRRAVTLLAACPRNVDALPPDAPRALVAFVERSGAMPTWAHGPTLARAQALFTRYGPWIMLALHCASLPYAYAAKRGVQVVARTGKMQSAAWRRLLATAQLVVDAMSRGAFAPTGAAIRSLQRVRLIHAAIRGELGRDAAFSAAWGVAINQEDMAGTVLSFSQVVVDALRVLDLPVDPADADAFIHAWDVAGALLGVAPALRMGTYGAAFRLARRIERRQLGPSRAGRQLTRALCLHLDEVTRVPGLPAALMRRFLGERVARDLGIDDRHGADRAIDALRACARLSAEVGRRSSIAAHAPDLIGRRILAALCRPVFGDDRATLALPPPVG